MAEIFGAHKMHQCCRDSFRRNFGLSTVQRRLGAPPSWIADVSTGSRRVPNGSQRILRVSVGPWQLARESPVDSPILIAMAFSAGAGRSKLESREYWRANMKKGDDCDERDDGEPSHVICKDSGVSRPCFLSCVGGWIRSVLRPLALDRRVDADHGIA